MSVETLAIQLLTLIIKYLNYARTQTLRMGHSVTHQTPTVKVLV